MKNYSESTEKIETISAIIWIDDEGILHLKIKDGAEIDLQEMKIIVNVYKKLGCATNKRLQLIEGSNYFTLDEQARNHSLTVRHKYLIATAIINNSLVVAILYEFIRDATRYPPIEIFKTRSEALDWLRKFKIEEKN